MDVDDIKSMQLSKPVIKIYMEKEARKNEIDLEIHTA
jgi:hypothetical protein